MIRPEPDIVSVDAPDRRLDLAFLAVVVVLGLAAGFVGTGRPVVGLALVAAAAGVCLLAVRPVLVAVLAVPAVYGYQSVGPGGALGLSDVLLLAGAFLALPALARSPAFRRTGSLTRGFVVYLALLLPSLLVHPSGAAGRELLHRVVLVVAAVLVGAWLVTERQVEPALRLLALISGFFAVASILTWLTNGHQAAYPLGYHKNYAGSLLALTLLILLCASAHVPLRTGLRFPAIGLLVAGLLATQSRGAILGAALGALLWLFAPGSGVGVRGRSRVVAVVLAVGFVLYSGQSVRQQLVSSNVETNSVGIRRDVETYTRELWRTSPVVGVGIRYFTSGEYGELAQAPNNAIDNELAESGLIGTAGFVGFHVVALTLLWRRRRTALGLTALALVSGQLLHGMVDIYWSSGITPLPFMLAGMALAEPAPRPDPDPEP